MTEPRLSPPAPVIERPTVGAVLKAQRKTIMVALIFVVASFWVLGPLGKWGVAALTATGIVLALVNHLYSELWLGRLISTGEEPTRGEIARAAIGRLVVLSVVAVGIAVMFWPDGIALLLGLAIFRLIALVMTWIPLLKELKQA
jgi:hypothetical protein